MKRAQLLLILLLVTTGASASQDLNVISVQHDKQRRVTCWVLNGVGISCLPDSSLPQQATPSNDTGRASPTSTAPKNVQQQAAPLSQNERLQL